MSEPDKIGSLKADNTPVILIEPLSQPGHNARGLVAFRYPFADDRTASPKRVTDMQVFKEFTIINTQKQAATFRKIFDRQTKHGVEDQ